MATVTRATRSPRAGIFSSPRNQRRLLIGSGAVLVAGIVAFVSMVVLRGTGNAFTSTFSNKPAFIYHQPKHVPLSKDEIAVARKFIATAVTRKDLDAAYGIVHPDLKGTLTRKQWDTGNIPVGPFFREECRDHGLPGRVLLPQLGAPSGESRCEAGREREARAELLHRLEAGHGSPTGRWLAATGSRAGARRSPRRSANQPVRGRRGANLLHEEQAAETQAGVLR